MIGFLAKLFKAPPEPVTVFKDTVLGEMKFNDDYEGWEFKRQGIRVIISYECEPVPKCDLLMYAVQALDSLEEYEGALDAAKKRYAEKNVEYAHEVKSLKIKAISFNRHKGKPWFLVSLGPGNNFREWRTEFHLMSYDCQISFDS